MTNLDEYIKKELKKGFSKSEIKKTLMESGWDKKNVEEAIKKDYEEEFPQHKKRVIKIIIVIMIIMLIIVIAGGLMYKYSYQDNKMLEKCQKIANPVIKYNCIVENDLVKKNYNLKNIEDKDET